MPILSRGAICRNYHSVLSQMPKTTGEQDVDSSCKEEIREEVHNDDIPFDNEDLFNKLFPNANDKLLKLIKSQSLNCQEEMEGKDRRSRRWDDDVLSLALSLWVASPVAYRILYQFMYLPTERLLQMYKNSLGKNPGINHDVDVL